MRMTGLVVAGCGLALLAAGTPVSPAEPASREKLRLAGFLTAYSSGRSVTSYVTGNQRGKGKSRNKGNYWNKGRSVNSGNFSNVIGSYNSNNSYRGSGNNVNGPQRITVRPKAGKWKCCR